MLEKEWVNFDAMDTSLYKEEAPLNEAIKSLKVKAVEEALAANKLNLVAEYSRATEGLVSTHMRAKVWPLLLGVETSDSSGVSQNNPERLFLSDVAQFGTNDLPPHKDEAQVMLDIKRLFTVMSHFNSLHGSVNSSFTTILSPDDIDRMRKRLFCLVVRVLRKYPCLNYYQGYHDVASVVLLLYNDVGDTHDERAFAVLEKLTTCHLRDFMISDIALSINHLKLIPCIVEEADHSLFELIRQTSNSYMASGGCYFDYKFLQGLLSVLTLFSHDIANSNHLMILWDFILSYKSVAASMYIYVAAILFYKEQIMEKLGGTNADLLTVDADLVHTLLLPSSLFGELTDLDLVRILTQAKLLIDTYPYTKFHKVSETYGVWFEEYNKHSVLCTTSRLDNYPDAPKDDFGQPLDPNGKKTDLQLSADAATVSLAPDASNLEALIMIQEEEQRSESIYSADEFQDSLEASITSLDGADSSRMGLLSSSLSNLSAASSAINHKLMHSSSVFFRKMFSRGASEEPEEPLTKRNTHLNLQSRLYKISLTVGFVGFMVHCLLKSSELRHSGISRMVHGDFGGLRPVLSLLDFSFVKSEIMSLGRELVSGASHVAGDVANFVRDSEVVNAGLDFTQIGLGSLRNSVYAFGN